MLRWLVSLFLSSFLVYGSLAQSVDPLTGRAVVNLPLGEISFKDLSVGVNLAHHGTSLKVNEGPGDAGMGWSVYVGGSVMREVRGLPDEINTAARKGWLHNSNAQAIQNQTFTADDNLAIATDETSDWNFINGRGYQQDTEPDVYYFQAPGLSGKFILGADGLPKLIPFQDLSVTFTTSSIIIRTNSGVTYTFTSHLGICST